MAVNIVPIRPEPLSSLLKKPTPKLFINDIDDTGEGQDRIRSHLYIELQGDIEIKPRCSCGKTTLHVASPHETVICPWCDTEPALTMDKGLESTLFFRVPKSVKALVQPQLIATMMQAYNLKTFNTVEYLLNKRYPYAKHSSKKAIELMKSLESAGIERGFFYFINNFDKVIDCLTDTINSPDARAVKEMVTLYRDRMFTDNIAFTSNLLFIMENSQGSKYYDATFKPYADAVMGLIGIEDRPLNRQDEILGKSLCAITQFYQTHFKTMYTGKSGLLRKVIYAAKATTGFRAVATAITGVHKCDEVLLPWSPTIQALHTHIVSVLMHRGYTLNNAYKFIQNSIHRYNEPMHDILKQIIAGAGPNGLAVLYERFPILGPGSMIMFYAKEVKTSPTDRSVGISIIAIRSSNLDFDGDEVPIIFIDDRKMQELLEPLSYSNVIFDRLRAGKISKNLELSKPVFANLSRFLEEGENNNDDPIKAKSMYDQFGV